MVSHRKTRSVSPQAADIYLRKAQEFANAMETALREEHWNAAALAAVHAAISAGDALLSAFVGLRSTEQDHRRIATLLADHLGDDGRKAAKHVQRVVGRKNLVEYEDRLVQRADALDMADHVRRLLSLAVSKTGGV